MLLLSGVYVAKAETVEVTTSFGTFEVDSSSKTAALVKGQTSAVVDSVLTVPDAIEHEGVSYPVTVIKEGGLKGFAAVKTLNLGANVEIIEDQGIYNFAACTQVNLNSKLRVIGEYGIGRMRKLTQILLPASLDSVSYSPFYSSSLLSQINVEEGSKKFSSRDGILYSKDGSVLYTVPEGLSLETLTLPAGVKKLYPYSFDSTDIKSVILPEGAEEIGDYAFEDCAIESIAFPATLKKIGSAVFVNAKGFKSMTVAAGNPNFIVEDGFLLSKDRKGCYISVERTGDCSIPQGVETIHPNLCFGMGITSLTMPSSVRTIGTSSFTSCKNLTSLKLNEGLDSIGKSAFTLCGLKEVSVPGTVTKMGGYIFNGCPSLEKAILEEGLTEICPYMFVNTAKLTEVVMPSTLKIVGNSSFQGSGLKSLNLPENLEVIEGHAFERAIVEGEIVIPEKVKVVGVQAFNYMPNVTSIKAPGVEVLEDISLGNCHALKTIILGDKLKKMLFGCVANNHAMDSICIPASVDTLGLTIFGGSPQELAAISVLAETPPAVGGEFFGTAALGKYETVRLHVPEASLQAYKDHPYWSKFVNIIADKSGAISEIENAEEATIEEIYTMTGVRLRELQPGVNIVRYSNGTTAKVIK